MCFIVVEIINTSVEMLNYVCMIYDARVPRTQLTLSPFLSLSLTCIVF